MTNSSANIAATNFLQNTVFSSTNVMCTKGGHIVPRPHLHLNRVPRSQEPLDIGLPRRSLRAKKVFPSTNATAVTNGCQHTVTKSTTKAAKHATPSTSQSTCGKTPATAIARASTEKPTRHTTQVVAKCAGILAIIA